MKYHIISLGCQMNHSDSERVRTVVERMGYVWTDREEEASLLGIVACSVRQKAIDKVYSKIRKWNALKDNKSLITFISGCILPSDRERFMKLFDIIFTMNELPRLPEFIHHYGVVTPAALSVVPAAISEDGENIIQSNDSLLNQISAPIQSEELPLGISLNKDQGLRIRPEKGIENFWDLSPQHSSSFEAFVPIQNGCDKFCTFCAVPYTRGREVSRLSADILAEVNSLIKKGYRSITLLGQNVNSYGFDKKGEELTFNQLLTEIGEIGDQSKRDLWVYFTAPHPRDMNLDVILTIAKYKCLANQIHLPLQSGDDKMLIRMNRKHALDDYRYLVELIREHLPTATLFTDIIVGFTGETEEQFKNTHRALEEFQFNMAYIACYSPRPGARSSKWDDDIPYEIKKERFGRLTGSLRKNYHELFNKYLGKELIVLVRGADKKEGFMTGLTEGRLIVRFINADKGLIGQFVKIKITSAATFSMEGDYLGIKDEVES